MAQNMAGYWKKKYLFIYLVKSVKSKEQRFFEPSLKTYNHMDYTTLWCILACESHLTAQRNDASYAW